MNFTEYLRGEFACVLWDERREVFVAVRDRYGIKPLFWTVQTDGKGQGGQRLLVAAEMKAFLPLGWEPEWDVRSLKDQGWGVDTRTLFRGVSKVRSTSFSVEESGWSAELPSCALEEDKHTDETGCSRRSDQVTT